MSVAFPPPRTSAVNKPKPVLPVRLTLEFVSPFSIFPPDLSSCHSELKGTDPPNFKITTVLSQASTMQSAGHPRHLNNVHIFLYLRSIAIAQRSESSGLLETGLGD